MTFKLTKADYLAIAKEDADYLNEKGANFYKQEDYATAIEYYRIAAAMGNSYSICNLGYCYMYARSIEKNMSLALAYFKIAAERNDVDALYKLGNIYKHGISEEGVEADEELALYYYRTALSQIEEQFLDKFSYPSLYFSLAKEHLENGKLITDYGMAYRMLKIAKEGYEREIENGVKFRAGVLDSIEEILQDPKFERYIANEDDYAFDDDDYSFLEED